jgi:predicted dehydrogenase
LATPAWDHYSQTIELLGQGKNLYVEKPLALTTPECLDIKSKIRQDQTLMVGHIFLYNDRVKKLKELLPRIGKVLHIESNRLNWGRYQKKISTLHSLAPHDVSIIHYLLGYHEFEHIVNIGDNFTDNSQNDRDEYSFICNDVSVKLNLSWYYPEKVRTMSITGTRGLLFWNEEKQSIKLTTDIWDDGRMNYSPKVEIFKIESNPLRNELIEFVECVSNNRKPLTDVDNAIQVASSLDLLLEGPGHQ